MADPNPFPVDRREFLQAGAVATAAATLAVGSNSAIAADEKAGDLKPVLTRKPLGKTGVDVTILNQGTVGQPDALERLLRVAYREGVRYFDTAEGYRNAEVVFGNWFEAEPAVRKSIFLATKSGVSTPSDMLKKIDTRLERLKTDYIDLLFFHGLETSQTDWPKSREMKEAIEAIKKTGKVKFVGFSTHDEKIAEQIQNAAEGGFVDVIMLKYDPWLDKDAPLNKALDACHEKGIGLVSMKQIAGQALKVTADRVPSLKARNLTPVQGLLHAIWSDERFSATCVTMRNLDQTKENVDAARRFEPLKKAELDELRAAVLAAGPTFCPNCDGRCAEAAGTKARLSDLARFYTYHEDHGIRGYARDCYAGLSEAQRDWKEADLEAAREACHNKIDFARILPEADRLLG
ncbi:aldo/keto reductase [Tundrisphaera lichenicola]|uniref:aldo/keto reductase n=1 Tax=Tundrisphaera lichenicola TaxID=2029860 RepID=UPI003EBD2BB8